jgi:hypothetical protein
MRKVKYLLSFVFAFSAGFFVIFNFNGNDISTNITNSNDKEKEYYQDHSGNLWENKNDYESYRDEEYFLAPDGTYWINEYRYEQSKL